MKGELLLINYVQRESKLFKVITTALERSFYYAHAVSFPGLEDVP